MNFECLVVVRACASEHEMEITRNKSGKANKWARDPSAKLLSYIYNLCIACEYVN
jgi:hypothetical protein